MVIESGVRINDPLSRRQDVKHRRPERLDLIPNWIVIPFTINVDKNHRVIALSTTLNYLV
jgi:hypothetical protein